MYFRQAWRDPRLVFEPINGRINDIRLYDGSWDFFWVPDTFFRNEKAASFHKVTVNNRRLTVNATGHLWYATRSVLFNCMIFYSTVYRNIIISWLHPKALLAHSLLPTLLRLGWGLLSRLSCHYTNTQNVYFLRPIGNQPPTAPSENPQKNHQKNNGEPRNLV